LSFADFGVAQKRLHESESPDLRHRNLFSRRGTNHLRVVWEAALNFSKWAFAKSGCFNFE
jgi:hypothetical protein